MVEVIVELLGHFRRNVCMRSVTFTFTFTGTSLRLLSGAQQTPLLSCHVLENLKVVVKRLGDDS